MSTPPFVAIHDIPFLNLTELGDRHVPLLPLWDGTRWSLWLKLEDEGFMEMHPVDVAASLYFAANPARDTDILFPFSNFIWQQASWPTVAEPARSIESRLESLSTAIAKIDFFWEHREHPTLDIADFVATEVEYVSVVARGVLDDLQKVMAAVWSKAVLVSADAQKRKRALPSRSMADMCLKGQKLRTAAELMATYSLPEPIAKFYERSGSLLQRVRRLRDSVVHGGTRELDQKGPVFVAEKGFATGCGDRLYEAFPDIWRDEYAVNSNVYSLRPLLAHLTLNVLQICSEAADVLSCCLRFPGPVAPGHRVFIRAPHNAALLKLQKVLQGGNPWWAT